MFADREVGIVHDVENLKIWSVERKKMKKRWCIRLCSGGISIRKRRGSFRYGKSGVLSSGSISSSCSGTVAGDWMGLEQQSGAKSGRRVIIVIDRTRESKTALLWALSHVVHKLDVVTLLQVIQPHHKEIFGYRLTRFHPRHSYDAKASDIASSFKALCAYLRPELEIETVIAHGEKGQTIVEKAKKLEASVLVLGQRKPRIMLKLLRHRMKQDGLVEYCIQNAECLTLAVRRKSKRLGGYLINSKWQRNFWLLA